MLPEVPSVGWWNASHDQSWGEDWHRHEGVEFAFLARGQLDLGVSGKLYTLRPGDLVITRPWQKHRIGAPFVSASLFQWLLIDVDVRRPNEPWKWPDWLVLSEADRAVLTALLRKNETPVWHANRAVRNSFAQLMAALETRTLPTLESRVKIRVNNLLADVLDMLRSRRVSLRENLTSTRRTVELFMESLPEHLGHPWTLEEMAGRCGLGRSRFAHYCKEITNLTPVPYLLRCRLRAAAKLLQSRPGQTVTEIAFACGFDSSQYFANCFRREYGCSPSCFRRQGRP